MDEGELLEWGDKIKELQNENKKLHDKIKSIKNIADRILQYNAQLEHLIDNKCELIFQQSKEIVRLYKDRSDMCIDFKSHGRFEINKLIKLVNDEEESDSDESDD